MPQAMAAPKPAITRDELAWLATLDDVESRIVFVDRNGAKPRYRAESGPFEESCLRGLPERDWTLLVYDLEKHLPEMRAVFSYLPFIPDWRIDDLMVSFAAPGGGVGPHRDNYDVFLCQVEGIRHWTISNSPVADDPAASSDLALLAEFDGEHYDTRAGDVLYLPPGVAHHGTAADACMTWSIGMRAPQLSDLRDGPSTTEADKPFYCDADLERREARPGYISGEAIERACKLLGTPLSKLDTVAESFGCCVTETKNWLRPEGATQAEAKKLLALSQAGLELQLHGMTRIAWDDQRVYVNGSSHRLPGSAARFMEALCRTRTMPPIPASQLNTTDMVAWLLRAGAFEIPEVS